MIAVLTGDIVSSRQAPDRTWLKRLGEIIEKKSGFLKVPKWTIFRGDGFQIELENPERALQLALLIRSGLKSIPELFEQGIDARVGIGIGKKEYTGKSVSESNGQAYQWSGSILDSLKESKYKFEVKTPWQDFDLTTNIALHLVSVIIDDWTQAEAEIVWLLLTEKKTQAQLAKKLQITQPAVQKRYAGAHLKEITNLTTHFLNYVDWRIENPKK